MTRKPITTEEAPAAIGPYSQSIAIEGLLFISGQLPIDPRTGEMPVDITEQTKQSLENLSAIARAAGGSIAEAVKVTVFLKDMNDFAAMNAVYESYFNDPYPARAAVEVARLPKDALIEIEAIVSIPR